jgi:hypothetical protein
MPSTSKKQHNFMEAIAHNPGFAKKVGVPRSVGEEFSKADKGKTFKKGGTMKMKETMGPRTMSKDVEKGSNKLGKFGESKVQKRGHTKGKELGITGKKEPIESEKNMKSFMSSMKKGGKVKKMAAGGFAYGESMAKVKTAGPKPHGDGIAERGKTRAMMPKMKGKTI